MTVAAAALAMLIAPESASVIVPVPRIPPEVTLSVPTVALKVCMSSRPPATDSSPPGRLPLEPIRSVPA